MRPCVLCVYWALLLISIVSSGLLFLIVALEGAQAKDPSFYEKNETYGTYNNITLNYDNYERLESSIILDDETQTTGNLEPYQNNEYQEDATTVSASFETINKDAQEKKDVDILAQSLTQQPNLSQGFIEPRMKPFMPLR